MRQSRLRTVVRTRLLRRHGRGRRIQALRRRAKYLIVLLEGDHALLIHLGMSGRLLLVPADAALEKHVHVIFTLDDGSQLRFRDPRRFGVVDIIPRSSLETDRRLSELGVEPLSKECTAEYFHRRTRGLRKPVKNFLMDARHVVGIGNIYASEALFLARVHPQRAVGRLSHRSWERVTGAIRTVLREALRAGGTTFNDFRDGNGKTGYFQVRLRVYGRAGEECPGCGSPVRSRVLAGRSTFYCSRCQR